MNRTIKFYLDTGSGRFYLRESNVAMLYRHGLAIHGGEQLAIICTFTGGYPNFAADGTVINPDSRFDSPGVSAEIAVDYPHVAGQNFHLADSVASGTEIKTLRIFGACRPRPLGMIRLTEDIAAFYCAVERKDGIYELTLSDNAFNPRTFSWPEALEKGRKLRLQEMPLILSVENDFSRADQGEFQAILDAGNPVCMEHLDIRRPYQTAMLELTVRDAELKVVYRAGCRVDCVREAAIEPPREWLRPDSGIDLSGIQTELAAKADRSELFSGAYADLTGKPELFTPESSGDGTRFLADDGSYRQPESASSGLSSVTENASVTTIANAEIVLSGSVSANGSPISTAATVASLIDALDIPSDLSELDDSTGLLFSKAYADLTGKPELFTPESSGDGTRFLADDGSYKTFSGGANGQDGQDGADGTDGVSSYVYYAYAADAEGGGWSATPASNLKYIAWIVSHEEITDLDSTHFIGVSWQKYLGDDGTAAGSGTGTVEWCSADATIAKNTLAFCTAGGITLTLDETATADGDRIKVCTGNTISADSPVTVAASAIVESACAELIIKTPNSAAEFIWNSAQAVWLVADPNSSQVYQNTGNDTVSTVNGTEWSRVHPDGWIEQGGHMSSTTTGYAPQTLVFPIPFSDTNYTIIDVPRYPAANEPCSYVMTHISEKTATSVTWTGQSSDGRDWYACGF